MRVGIPTEIKNNENRVAITPAGVHSLAGRGHEVLVQSGAGTGSRILDADYAEAGATIVADADARLGRGRSAREGQGARAGRVLLTSARIRRSSPTSTSRRTAR